MLGDRDQANVQSKNYKEMYFGSWTFGNESPQPNEQIAGHKIQKNICVDFPLFLETLNEMIFARNRKPMRDNNSNYPLHP